MSRNDRADVSSAAAVGAAGVLHRRAALAVVYGLVPAAGACLAASLYAWWRTFGLTRRFLREGSTSFAPDAEVSTVEKLLRLDISTVSALILVLLSAFVLLGSVRVVRLRMQAGSWRAFRAQIYHERFLPIGLAAVSVRLGLIGTLVSFVLIATMLFRDPAALAHGGDFVRAESQRQVAEAGSAPGPTATQPALGREDAVGPAVGPTGQTSFLVFLLLCASLYSTLVGCGAGYVVVPVLQRVAATATGQTRLDRLSPDLLRQEYARRMAEATQELSLLTQQAGSIRTAAADLTACAQAIRESQHSLASIRPVLARAAETTTEVREVAAAIRKASRDLHGAGQTILNAGHTYQSQSANAELLLKGLQDTTASATRGLANAVGEIQKVATAMHRDVLTPSGSLLASMGELLGALRDDLHAVFKAQADQRRLTEGAVNSIAACAEPLCKARQDISACTRDLRALCGRGASSSSPAQQAAGPELAKALEEIRQCLDDLRIQRTARAADTGSTDTEASLRHYRQAAADMSATLSPDGAVAKGFWRRVFGRSRHGNQG